MSKQVTSSSLEQKLNPVVLLCQLWQTPDILHSQLSKPSEDKPLAWLNPSKVLDLVSQGLTFTDLARSLDISSTSLHDYIHRHCSEAQINKAFQLRADAIRTNMMDTFMQSNITDPTVLRGLLDFVKFSMKADDPGNYQNKPADNKNITNNHATLVIHDATRGALPRGHEIIGELVSEEDEFYSERYEQQRKLLIRHD